MTIWSTVNTRSLNFPNRKMLLARSVGRPMEKPCTAPGLWHWPVTCRITTTAHAQNTPRSVHTSPRSLWAQRDAILSWHEFNNLMYTLWAVPYRKACAPALLRQNFVKNGFMKRRQADGSDGPWECDRYFEWLPCACIASQCSSQTVFPATGIQYLLFWASHLWYDGSRQPVWKDKHES